MASAEPIAEPITEPTIDRQRAWQVLSHRSDQLRQAVETIGHYRDPNNDRRSVEDRRNVEERRTAARLEIEQERRARRERRLPWSDHLQVLLFELMQLTEHRDILRQIRPSGTTA